MLQRVLAVSVIAIVLSFCTRPLRAQESTSPVETAGDFSASDVAAANSLVQSLGVADWMGPLAPVALSPFFGIACLSGMSLYGQSWVSADNAFLGAASPLNNSSVFWMFLILTLVTSIPRFTKVSKPFAQAVDRVEAWAGIITLLALKVMLGDAPAEPDQVVMLNAGIGSVTIDGLLMIAAVINVLVINSVKFFFEVLIWVTPIPAVDAVFEVANKSVCVSLMAVYGYSPFLATTINLAMFGICAVVFGWIYRRQVFYRTILIDAVWQLLAPSKKSPQPSLIVFPAAAVGGISARSKCTLVKTEMGWDLTRRSLFGSTAIVSFDPVDTAIELDAGYLSNSLKITGVQPCELTFSRWHNAFLPQLAALLAARLNEQGAKAFRLQGDLRRELAS